MTCVDPLDKWNGMFLITVIIILYTLSHPSYAEVNCEERCK